MLIFYNWFRFRVVGKGYRAQVIIKICLRYFSSDAKLLIFLSIWGVLLCIFVLFIYNSFSRLIDLLHNMQSVERYNLNLGLILTLFFRTDLFLWLEVTVWKNLPEFIGIISIILTRGPWRGVLNIEYCSKYLPNINYRR